MTIPGRAVQIVMVTSFSVRSMTIRETLALARRSLRYLRILRSSTRLSPKFLPPNQFDSQPRIIPSRLLIGLTFCPILLLFFVVSFGFYKQSDVIRTLTDSKTTTLWCGSHTFHSNTSVNEDFTNIKFTIFSLAVIFILPVSNC